MHHVRVDLHARESLNFALLHAGVPVVPVARVVNTGDTRLTDLSLVLRLQPDLGPPVVRPIEPLHPGEWVNLESIDLQVPPGRLRTVVEAERAELAWEVRRADETLASGAHPLEVLA